MKKMKEDKKMMLKYLVLFVFLFSCCSCAKKKSFEREIVLKSLPSKISYSTESAKELSDYANNIRNVDVDKVLSQIKIKNEQDKFKNQMIILRTAYNKCVDKIAEIEKAYPKDKEIKMKELKEQLYELDAIWKFIIRNYNI
jgi:hypothetical protein